MAVSLMLLEAMFKKDLTNRRFSISYRPEIASFGNPHLRTMRFISAIMALRIVGNIGAYYFVP